MRRAPLWLHAVLLTTLAVPVAAEDAVSVRVVTDRAQLVPGEPVLVGTVFDIRPGWHIYWQNPGEAGLATAVEVEAPEGFDAGPVQWPLPVAFDQSEGVPGYGYEGQVMLVRRLAVPAAWRAGDEAALSVTASWLACRDVCVFGEREMSLRLPRPAAEVETARALFEEWRRRLPSDDPLPAQLSVSRALPPDQRSGELTAWLSWPGKAPPLEWFPAPGEGLKVEDATASSRANLTRLDARVTTVGQRPSNPVLESLLVVKRPDGSRIAYPFTIPFRDSE